MKSLTAKNAEIAKGITTADLPAAIQQDVEAARQFHRGTLQAEDQFKLYAFLCGVKLIGIKDALAHGEFMDFREEVMPEISRAAATRFMEFSRLVETKLLTVSNLTLPPAGPVDDPVKEQLAAALEAASEGRSMSKWVRDLKAEADRGKKRKRLSAAERAEGEKRHARELLRTALANMTALITDADTLSLLDDEDWQEALDTGTEWTSTFRTLIKNQKHV